MATNTPNMGLTKPGVNTEPGPDWATQLNSSLDTLDVHDHSSGKGIRITPPGLNINSDFDIQNNDLLNVNHVRLSSTTGSGIDGVYQNGGNLYWRNNAGVDVQITAGNTINVGSLGTIGGDYSTDPNNPLITFTTATGNYDFFKDTVGSPIAGGINCGDLTIFEEISGSNGISIISPSSLAAAYTITLPPAQAASNNSLISVAAAGTWQYTRDPTADSLGVQPGGLGAPSVYNETNTTTGIYFSAVNNFDVQTNSIRAINVDDNQFTTFYPAEISDALPSAPGEIKLANSAAGAAETSIAMYSEGVNGWNRFIGVLGVSDDSGSNPVIEYSARRNTDTNFGTRTVMHRFTNSSDTLLDIERTRLVAYRNGDDDVFSMIGDSTTNTVRQFIKNSDSSRNFNFSAFFGAGTEKLNIQSDSETFFELIRGGNVLTSKQIIASGTGVSDPGFSFSGNETSGLFDNGGNPAITRSGVRRLELTSTAVFFNSGMELGDSGSERLGTGYFTVVDSPTVNVTTGNITTLNTTTGNITTLNTTTGNITTVNATTLNATGDMNSTGINTDNVVIRHKKLTDVFQSSTGLTRNVTHGLTRDNIIGVQVASTSAGGIRYLGAVKKSAGAVGVTDAIEVFEVTSTQIRIIHQDSALNSRAFEMLVTYED